EACVETAAGARHAVRVGRPAWLRSEDRPECAALLAELRAKGGHRIDVEVDGRLTAVALVRERLRDSAPAVLQALGRMNLPVAVLTGDTAAHAQALALPDVAAGLSPEAKRQAIREMGAKGTRPLFVGDGVNDAGALAAAHVGIALASGSDLAVGAADAVLYHAD